MARQDIESQLDPFAKNMTVNELVERYLSTKTGVKPNTQANYNFVKNLLEKEEFGRRKIRTVKTSDAKLFLVKLQSDGKGCSTIKTIRGVLRPAFQMAVDDDILNKNPFGFELANVIVNDSQKREALTQKQMKDFSWSGYRFDESRSSETEYVFISAGVQQRRNNSLLSPSFSKHLLLAE